MAARRDSPTLSESPLHMDRSSSPPTITTTASTTSTTTTTSFSPAAFKTTRSASISSVSSLNSIHSLRNGGSPAVAVATTNTTAVQGANSFQHLESPHHLSPNTTPATATASNGTYFPSFPVRNKSRTPSVSSTSTLTQPPVHSLLQTSPGGIHLSKRQAAPPSLSSPALSTTSATTVTASTTLSAATSSTSLSASSSTASLVSSNGNSNNNNTKSNSSKSSSNTTTNTTTMNGNHHHSNGITNTPTTPILVLEPVHDSFILKSLELPEMVRIKIGRQTGVTTAPGPSNGYFDSKVLSRVHAEVWSDKSGKIYIKDLKSSNGTFLNGNRLCPDGVESEPFVLNEGDNLEFGIDILDENGALLHEKVACKIYISRASSSFNNSTSSGSSASLVNGQDGHSKSKNSSPNNSIKTNAIANGAVSTNAALAGQSANIDLIMSRLQGELARSQETNGDLNFLKQGLGELEKVFVVTSNSNNKDKGDDARSIHSNKSGHFRSLHGNPNGHQSSGSSNGSAISYAEQQQSALLVAEYERTLADAAKEHAAEMEKMTATLESTKAELEAYVQKCLLLEPLVAQDEIMRRDLQQALSDLSKSKQEKDQVKDAMNEMINDHQQTLAAVRKEHEQTLVIVKQQHHGTLEFVKQEHQTVIEHVKQGLVKEVQELKAELEKAKQALKDKEDKESSLPSPAPSDSSMSNAAMAAAAAAAAASAALTIAQEEELKQLKETTKELQKKVKEATVQVQELQSEKSNLESELKQSKVALEQSLASAASLAKSEDLSNLTPTSATSTSSPSTIPPNKTSKSTAVNTSSTTTTTTTKRRNSNTNGGVATTVITTTHAEGDISSSSSSDNNSNNSTTTIAPKYEFSWGQFMLPRAKKNQPLMNQPSTMLMSGGFMLVGLGAYVFWHRIAGGSAN